MPKYLMIDDSGSIWKADAYGESELEAVIDGALSVVDITDPDNPTDLDEDGDFIEIEDWVM